MECHQGLSEQASTCGNPSCGCWGGSCSGDDVNNFVSDVRAFCEREGLTTSQLKDRIESIDLTWVKRKITDKREGKGWSAKKADEIERSYKRFLFLFATTLDVRVVPTLDIDALWHQHILDTRAYFADCDRVFGTYLHHFPYFGLRGDEDAKHLDESFKATCVLYKSVFGDEYVAA